MTGSESVRSRLGRFLATSGFGLLLLFVLVVPLFDGAVTLLGQFWIQCAAVILALCAAFSVRDVRLSRTALLFLAMLLLPAAVGIFQLIPFSPGWLQRLSPESARTYAESSELLKFSNAASPLSRISLSYSQTFNATLLIVSYALLFWSASVLTRTTTRWTLLRATLVSAAMIQLAISAFEGKKIGGSSGSFLVSNQLAAYLQVSIALAVTAWTTRKKRSPRFLTLLWAPITALLVIGIVPTKSMAGIASAGVALALILLLRRTRSTPSIWMRSLIASIPPAAIAATVVASRLDSQPSLPLSLRDRLEFWSLSLQAWGRFPLLGSGLGTFADAFQAVQPQELDGLVAHAHSDFLQLLVTGGLAAVLSAAGAYGVMCILLLGRDKLPEPMIAAAACFFSIMLHGAVEFNFSVPAIPATLICLLGAATAMNVHEGRTSPVTDGY